MASDGLPHQAPQELAAINLVRLTRGTPAISEAIAERGGIKPLVRLLNEGSPGAIYWAGACHLRPSECL